MYRHCRHVSHVRQVRAGAVGRAKPKSPSALPSKPCQRGAPLARPVDPPVRMPGRPSLAAALAAAAVPAPPPDPAATLAAARCQAGDRRLRRRRRGATSASPPSSPAPPRPRRRSRTRRRPAPRAEPGRSRHPGRRAVREELRGEALRPTPPASASPWPPTPRSRRTGSGASVLLSGWVKKAFDRRAPLDLRIPAHALLGRALAKLNDGKKAEAEYALVRDLWRDPEAGVKAIQDDGGDDRRLARALTAVGEARFFFAEQRRREVEEDPLPRVQGEERQGHGPGVAAHQGPGLGEEEARRDRGRRERLPGRGGDPAGAAAAVGHRLRQPGRPDVGEVQRGVPGRARPQGVEGQGDPSPGRPSRAGRCAPSTTRPSTTRRRR